MKKLLLFVLSVFIAPLAFVGMCGAATLQWDRNIEPDMKEYNIYGCDTGITCSLGTSKLGTVPQPAVGIIPSFPVPSGLSGVRAVSAVDTFGNESALSVPAPFDGIAPSIPVNPRVKP